MKMYEHVMMDWLVVWNMTFIFLYIRIFIIPLDFHIFIYFSEG